MQVIVYSIIFLGYLFPLLQPPFPFPGNGNPKGPWPGDDPGIPIVESISFLLSAGMYLGIKFFRKTKKNNH